MVAERRRHSHGGDREVGQGREEIGRALCFCYVKDSADVTKEVDCHGCHEGRHVGEGGGGQSHEDGS